MPALLFLTPPSLQKTALAARSAGGARWAPVRLVIPPLSAPLTACARTSRTHTALNGAGGRSLGRTVVVGVGICGAGARCEEWVWGRTGVAPSGVGICAGVSGSPGAGGVVADAVLQIGAGSAGAEEIDRAAAGGAVCGTDDGEGVAEDVADVEVAGRVRFEDRAVGVGLAVGAHVGYADLAGEAGA